jgi:hypothetical protein
MTKKNNFEDDNLVNQPDIGCYYHGNMFRFPEEELTRIQMQPPKMPPTMQKNTQKIMPQTDMMPMDEEPMTPPVLSNTSYTQGFLKTLIGKKVRISFLIGTSLLVDRVGTLLEVGVSYVVLQQIDATTKVMADLYSIKFVDIYSS